VIVSSDSVGQALDRLVRYLRIVTPDIQLAIRDKTDPIRVVVERAFTPFQVELTVSLSVVRFTRETDEACALRT